MVVVNSEVLCGLMDKATVRSGKKNSIVTVMMRDFGLHEVAAAMNLLDVLRTLAQ